uniref:Kinesin motor domain-containing protein n=1 Tax=Glossina austeni TaxID=7395 RepID=A0A1A9UIQ4_GLOAU
MDCGAINIKITALDYPKTCNLNELYNSRPHDILKHYDLLLYNCLKPKNLLFEELLVQKDDHSTSISYVAVGQKRDLRYDFYENENQKLKEERMVKSNLSIEIKIKLLKTVVKNKMIPAPYRAKSANEKVQKQVQRSADFEKPGRRSHVCYPNFAKEAVTKALSDAKIPYTEAKPIVHSAIEGCNGTIFAYGHTSSGKTYNMMGDEENPGVMVLAAKEIFKEI